MKEDLEEALVYFYKGRKIRPDMKQFKTGCDKVETLIKQTLKGK